MIIKSAYASELVQGRADASYPHHVNNCTDDVLHNFEMHISKISKLVFCVFVFIPGRSPNFVRTYVRTICVGTIPVGT